MVRTCSRNASISAREDVSAGVVPFPAGTGVRSSGDFAMPSGPLLRTVSCEPRSGLRRISVPDAGQYKVAVATVRRNGVSARLAVQEACHTITSRFAPTSDGAGGDPLDRRSPTWRPCASPCRPLGAQYVRVHHLLASRSRRAAFRPLRVWEASTDILFGRDVRQSSRTPTFAPNVIRATPQWRRIYAISVLTAAASAPRLGGAQSPQGRTARGRPGYV